MERDSRGRVKVYVCTLACFDKDGNHKKTLRKGSISQFEVITWADYERKVWEYKEQGNKCETQTDSTWVDEKVIESYIREVEG